MSAPLDDVLFEALRFFVHRDESNAAIHCGRVRYSPLTFRLAEQLVALDTAGELGRWTEDATVVAVLADAGMYEEDKGR